VVWMNAAVSKGAKRAWANRKADPYYNTPEAVEARMWPAGRQDAWAKRTAEVRTKACHDAWETRRARVEWESQSEKDKREAKVRKQYKNKGGTWSEARRAAQDHKKSGTKGGKKK
jgi:hypothetical protein